MRIDLRTQTVGELLQLYSEILQELTTREICRSTNNPVADVAELLVVRALGLTRCRKSMKGYDAEDAAGKRYEIKSRRLTAHNESRMLSAIRDCEAAHFDYLAGVLFEEDFSVAKACLIPFQVVLARSTYRKHTNAHIFELTDDLWQRSDVRDITSQVAEALAILDSTPRAVGRIEQLASEASGCLWCTVEKESSRRLNPGEPRRCPLCDRAFAGLGWGGIDGHWRSMHSREMRYEEFWSALCNHHRA